MKILLVEDEKIMAEALVELLRQEHYLVDVVYDGRSGYEMAGTGEYDALILDIMLPNMSGLEIITRLRQEGVYTPTIMLTAKSEVSDKIQGLDSGADDYLTKPFVYEELSARIRALLRRKEVATGTSTDGHILQQGDLTLNRDTATVSSKQGSPMRLPEKEYHLLAYFMENYGQILNREQIAIKIWGYDSEAEYNNVEVYISFLRKKLRFLQSKMEIKSHRGLGYELRMTDV